VIVAVKLCMILPCMLVGLKFFVISRTTGIMEA
jgi:hypothetical protein